MNVQTVKGYVLTILSGLVLVAAALLIALQWGQTAGFSLYGKQYGIFIVDGGVRGGLNTALLMVFSAIGGVVVVLVGRVFVYGLRALLAARRPEAQHRPAEPKTPAS